MIYAFVYGFGFSCLLASIIFFFRKRRISAVACLLVGVGTVLFSESYLMDTLMLTKDQVRADLKLAGLALGDDFKILKSRHGGMPERITVTRVRISERDKQRIISEIKNAENPRILQTSEEIAKDVAVERRHAQSGTLNYVNPVFYTRVFFGKVGRQTTRIFVYIEADSDILVYKKIE